MDKKIKILILEDNPDDALLITRQLNKSGLNFQEVIVNNKKAYIKQLDPSIDIILSDFNLPGLNALGALEIMQEKQLDIPFIIVSGAIGEEMAISCIKKGVDDYLLKDRLHRLTTAIEKTIFEKNLHKEKNIALSNLAANEKMYRTLFETMAQGVLYLNRNGEIISTNPAAEKILGYTSEQLYLKKNSNPEWSSIHEDGSKFSLDEHPSSIALKNGKEVDQVVMGVYNPLIKNYKWIIIHAIPVFNHNENEAYQAYITIEDITVLKNAENQLKKSEEKFSKVFKDSPTPICISRLSDGTIIDSNPSFSKLTGYSLDEIIGKSTLDLGLWNEIQGRDEIVKNLLADGKVLNIERQARVKSGEIKEALISFVIIEIGAEQCILTALIDITIRKKMLEETIKAKENAEEMNKMKSRFLANMSHELRTPLIGILGYSEVMKNELITESYRTMAETIFESGSRLLETLNSLLDLSKIEANKVEISFEPLNVAKFVDESVKVFKLAASGKNLNLDSNYESSNLFINADQKIFIQIMNNLINNAIKFTPEGSVFVRVYTETTDSKKWILISVKDTGIGIPENNMEKIFEEFRQASEGDSRRYEGTGLGLTITKKFVDLIGGTIIVKSQPGAGSEFIIKFPEYYVENVPEFLTENNSSIDSEKLSFKPPLVSKQKILLVEDDRVTQQITKLTLKDYYDIDICGNAEVALIFLQKNKYPVILLDINLGTGLNGIELIQKIREIPNNKNSAVIAYTAYAMEGDREKFLENGCDDYISKPYSKAHLFEVIQRNLNPNPPNQQT